MRIRLAIAFCTLAAAQPAAANITIEPTFQEKWDQSQLIVIGTVTAVYRGGPSGFGSTATVSVRNVLRGQAGQSIIVETWHPSAELDPRCCSLGTTYLLFLRGPGTRGTFSSVHGIYGMVNIGGPGTRLPPIPEGARPIVIPSRR
jgi:hypothetical protein